MTHVSPTQPLRIERWSSNDNQAEVHLFLGGEYLIGYNPARIDEGIIRLVLKEAGIGESAIRGVFYE